MSATPPLRPIRPSHHARFLDDGQLGDLRAASLEILEEVGVHCPSKGVRALYAEHGALVDEAREVVNLPADLVVRAMARAPRGYVMGARDPAFDLSLDGTALYVATDGCGTAVLEPNGDRRASTAADVATAARLADAIPSASTGRCSAPRTIP
jgi:trimethylamine:corrinoid methyltransferase-like protein